MGSTVQTILVILTLGLAIGFLVRKYLWKPKKRTNGSCSNDDCGCH